MSNQADPLKAKDKAVAERAAAALPIDSQSAVPEGEGQRSSHKAHYLGGSVTGASRERWHLMLDEIFNSDARECIEAITVNLEAYCSAARAFKALKAHPAERRKVDRRRSERPKVSSGV